VWFLFEGDRLKVQHRCTAVTNTEATTASWPASMRGAFLVGAVLFDAHLEDEKVSDAHFILILLRVLLLKGDVRNVQTYSRSSGRVGAR
jgi:hypothetical protein